LNNIVD